MLFDNTADKYFIFKPSRNHIGTPKDLGIEFDDLYFKSAPNITLHGWFINKGSEQTIVWLHGNGGNISHRIYSLKTLYDNTKYNIFIFDYRGYGKSDGNVSESGSYQDSLSAIEFLNNIYSIQTNQLILFGKSLGCSIACEIATKITPLALLLESAFTSIRDMTRFKFPFLPGIEYLISNKFNTYGKINQINCPILFVHGDLDSTIPINMGGSLYEKYQNTKLFIKAKGAGHNNVEEVLGINYFKQIESFVTSNCSK